MAGLEVACRTLGWGFPTSFLVADTVAGRPVWRTNEFYGYRFFRPLMARSPMPVLIDRVKTAGLTRVAVLGESAAMGDPLVEFGLARALDKSLNAPGAPRRFEVVNAAMTAISSPVVVDIAENLARADVDAFVVYMGNNEVIGPYAPGSAFRGGRLGGWLTPWHVRWTGTRLASAAEWWRSATSPGAAWDGMAMFADSRFPAADPRLDEVYAGFERNLDRLVGSARRRGIEVILCTVATNLRDCPPFGSAHGSTLDADDSRAWHEAFEAGSAALEAGDAGTAGRALSAALELDSGHALLTYLAAIAAERTDDGPAAERLYRRARDLDTLRVRTDTRLNQAIRAVAERRGTTLVESDAVFGPAPGAESFVDHVHFTVAGVTRLAQAVARALDAGSPAVEADALAERLGHDAWSRSKLATIMEQRLAHPPFRDQFGNDTRQARWRAERRSAAADLAAADTGHVLAGLRARQADYPWDDEYAIQTLHRLAGSDDWSRAAGLADDIRPRLRGASAVAGLVALVYAKADRAADAAEVLVATGPPYGYFLVDAVFQMLEALAATGDDATAGAVAGRILDRGGDFPGREALVRWRDRSAGAGGSGVSGPRARIGAGRAGP